MANKLKEQEAKIRKLIDLIDSGKAQKDIVENVNKKQKKKMEKIGKSAIDEYYDMPRTYYDPTHSLYNAYKIENNNGDIVINTDDPSLIPDVHRVSSEYIYEKMFVEGWHGGAEFDNGKMSIPVIYPVKPYDGRNGRPWEYQNKKAKWKPAVQGVSPKKTIDDAVEEYYNNELSEDVADAMKDWRKEVGI